MKKYLHSFLFDIICQYQDVLTHQNCLKVCTLTFSVLTNYLRIAYLPFSHQISKIMNDNNSRMKNTVAASVIPSYRNAA